MSVSWARFGRPLPPARRDGRRVGAGRDHHPGPGEGAVPLGLRADAVGGAVDPGGLPDLQRADVRA